MKIEILINLMVDFFARYKKNCPKYIEENM